jgi:hypothetical protein
MDMASKHRSPNFPVIGLPEAVSLAQKIWDKEKRTPLSALDVAKIGGYTSISGPSRQLVSALGKYGLLEPAGKALKLSDLAIQILHGQPREKEAALIEAGNKVALFRQLAQSHGDASEDSLKSYLIVQLKFSEDGAKKCIKAFLSTKSIAKLNGGAKIEGDDNDDDLGDAPSVGDWVQWLNDGVHRFPQPQQIKGISDDGEWAFFAETQSGIPMSELELVDPPTGAQKTTKGSPPPNPLFQPESTGPRIEFPLPDGNAIEIRLRKPVSKKDFERIKMLVELSEDSLVSDE